MALLARQVEGCRLHRHGIHVGLRVYYQREQLRMPVLAQRVQWSEAGVDCFAWACTRSKQELHAFAMALHRRAIERCEAMGTSSLLLSARLEQYLDYRCVAKLCRSMQRLDAALIHRVDIRFRFDERADAANAILILDAILQRRHPLVIGWDID